MGKGNSSKVNDSKWSNWFCSKILHLFTQPASQYKPFLYTAWHWLECLRVSPPLFLTSFLSAQYEEIVYLGRLSKKKGLLYYKGQKKRKGNSSKVNDSKQGVKLTCFHLFTQPSIISHFFIVQGQEGGKEGRAGAKKGKENSSKLNDSKRWYLFISKIVWPFHPASHI